ncbi:hypothetical protein Aca07nite_42100 [Actinoplanes capillaceus]|uniref:Barstar (Barnase inhibitor) n=1 Tax=Actinoplanes campanulatus TaxID=113559 RepID=A0ABQ3WL47_9ACTN|nr:hypothetical protein [Actinoplanes capillaceus]GID46935.1 hypothetical protein Aca07nite_42100 [Actinoplanes capillaceus]
MADLRWEDVARYFEDDGSLLDAYVFDVSMTDWQLILDAVRSVGWPHDYSSGGGVQTLPGHIEDIFERRRDCSPTLHIRPAAGIVFATHFFSPENIEFDFDPDDVQGQQALDVLCSFLRTVGQKLNRQVVLTPESSPEVPLIIYSPADDRFAAIRRSQ